MDSNTHLMLPQQVLAYMGRTREIHVSINAMLLLVSTDDAVHRILMRPKNATGSFHIGIIGQNFDPADLVDEKKFTNFIREHSGRMELVFKNFTSLSYWK